MRAHAVSLSDYQLKLVHRHAASLPLQLRGKYLRVIADRLTGEPSDGAVAAAINLALDAIYAFANQRS